MELETVNSQKHYHVVQAREAVVALRTPLSRCSVREDINGKGKDGKGKARVEFKRRWMGKVTRNRWSFVLPASSGEDC